VYDDPDEDGAYDNSQRHLSDFIMQQQSNLEQAPRTIPLLCLKSNRQQSLYVDFNPGSNQEEVDLIKTVKDMRDDPDLAALRIQCWWRTFLGKLEFEEMKKEHSRRERAAVRLQCMWRGRMGYANMLKMRAKNHDESDGAMRIQGLWRGKSSRQMFNEKRADLKAENDSACRIQSLYRGRQSRSETLRRKKAARSVGGGERAKRSSVRNCYTWLHPLLIAASVFCVFSLKMRLASLGADGKWLGAVGRPWQNERTNKVRVCLGDERSDQHEHGEEEESAGGSKVCAVAVLGAERGGGRGGGV